MVELNRLKPQDLWYVVGYIATDGYLSSDGRHINITSKDRGHLYSIRNSLALKNKIGRKTRTNGEEKNYSQLQFGSVNFYKYLETLGITPKKSLTIGKINIDNTFFVDFLRGVIDGDGNISSWTHRTNGHTQWCLRIYSASSEFIEWINTAIEIQFGFKGKLYARKEKNKMNFIYSLKFGKLVAVKILQSCYYKGSLALKRKSEKASLCLQSRGKNDKLYT